MPIPTKQEAAAIFKPLGDVLRATEFTDAQVFDLIANFTQLNPFLGIAFAREIAIDLAATHGVVSYADIVASAYFSVFFDDVRATQYHTNLISRSAPAMKDYVSTYLAHAWADNKMADIVRTAGQSITGG